MNITPNLLAALHVAGNDDEGRLVVIDLNNGPLSAIGNPGEAAIPIGDQGLQDLLKMGLLKYDGGDSYLLTGPGWRAIGKMPPRGHLEP